MYIPKFSFQVSHTSDLYSSCFSLHILCLTFPTPEHPVPPQTGVWGRAEARPTAGRLPPGYPLRLLLVQGLFQRTPRSPPHLPALWQICCELRGRRVEDRVQGFDIPGVPHASHSPSLEMPLWVEADDAKAHWDAGHASIVWCSNTSDSEWLGRRALLLRSPSPCNLCQLPSFLSSFSLYWCVSRKACRPHSAQW